MEIRGLYDPRFHLMRRGSAPNWEDLNGRWAVPGIGYGEQIVAFGQAIRSVPDPDPVPRPIPEPGPLVPDPETGEALLDWKTEAMAWLVREALINSEHDPDAPVTWAEFGTVLRRVQQKLGDN